MLDDKKAQIGETMTWVVATLVIVVILSISVLFTVSFSGQKLIFLDDKEKDFIATKSIASFLMNKENIDFLESKNEKEIESNIKIFLEKTSSKETINPGGWNLEIERGDEKIYVDTYRIVGFESDYDINLNSEELKLHFWKECQGGCIR